MKNYIKLLVLVPAMLLSTSIVFAQSDNLEDEIVRENVAEYQVIETELAEDKRILEETKAIFPVVFDESDAYKLNQSRILVEPSLETTFKLDTNRDFIYEREITINYIRPENFNYDFMLTEKGLKVWLDDNGIMVKEIHMIDKNNKKKKKVKMLTSKGMYNIILNNGKVYEIEVKNMK